MSKDIRLVTINQPMQDGHTVYGSDQWAVGLDGVTSIRLVSKEGPMCYLTYVEVWKGDHLHAEYAQHNIVGVEYMPPLHKTDGGA